MQNFTEMKKHLLSLVFASILFSCSTESVFKVSRVGEEPEQFKQRAVYSLPQTLFLVSVEFEKESYIPGPYRLFTERFLGLEDYIAESGVSYRLLNVDVENFTEPDPDQFYSINLLKGELEWEEYLKLSDYGLILEASRSAKREYSSTSTASSRDMPYFTDLSVKRNLTEVTDTLYKTIIRDSSYVRVPVLRSHREAKTLEQKAEEAANFIIKIRKRRFKLLAGQYELFPEGDALAISVKELDKLEKEYLELFLGKRVKEKYRKRFIVLPEEGNETATYSFARFSPQTGILEKDENAGKALELKVDSQKKLNDFSAINLDMDDDKLNNNLFYRIPEIAEVRVMLVNEVLYQGRMPVYQLGKMVNLPVTPKEE
jgi:hypothetical protein